MRVARRLEHCEEAPFRAGLHFGLARHARHSDMAEIQRLSVMGNRREPAIAAGVARRAVLRERHGGAVRIGLFVVDTQPTRAGKIIARRFRRRLRRRASCEEEQRQEGAHLGLQTGSYGNTDADAPASV